MRVLGNRLLVQPLPQSMKSRGGLHLPPAACNGPGDFQECRVVSVGPGRLTKRSVMVPMEAQPGDRILCKFDHHGATELPGGLQLIPAEAILAVLP